VTADSSELEGYIIDLLADLSSNTSIDLTPVTPVADGKYGEMERGVWNGMIKELIDNVRETIVCFLFSDVKYPLKYCINARPIAYSIWWRSLVLKTG